MVHSLPGKLLQSVKYFPWLQVLTANSAAFAASTCCFCTSSLDTANATCRARPLHDVACNSLIARDASAAVLKVTKPKPRDTPSPVSFTVADTTVPNRANFVKRSASVNSLEKFLTKTVAPCQNAIKATTHCVWAIKTWQPTESCSPLVDFVDRTSGLVKRRRTVNTKLLGMPAAASCSTVTVFVSWPKCESSASTLSSS